MAYEMNGGKPHGGRAYDSSFSAFQKKGLISPLAKREKKKKPPKNKPGVSAISKYVREYDKNWAEKFDWDEDDSGME